jgi:hypothetical protein
MTSIHENSGTAFIESYIHDKYSPNVLRENDYLGMIVRLVRSTKGNEN